MISRDTSTTKTRDHRAACTPAAPVGRPTLTLAAALAVALCALAPVRASDGPASPDQPKRVAVAFGGGSALGLSHIGFLRWMEEHHVPVRAVAGTSMGGLIGGLYASGYTAAEIETFVEHVNWNRAMSTGPAYNELAFRRKQDRRDFPNPLELGLRRGRLSLPPGVSPGNGVGLVISSFTAPYGELASFDDLPTPFRCVAVDLVSGERVVFDRGSLFDALRSTMSIPAYFAPWRIGNQVLVDGGLLDNLPTDVAREMGDYVVVAVELETPPLEKHPRLNLLGVAQRSVSVVISNNERRNMALADILVMPDLRGFNSLDYERYREFIELGYRAAEKKSEQLLRYRVDDAAWQSYVAARAARRKHRPEQVDFVELSGADERFRPLFERRAAQVGPLPADPETIANKLTQATESGRFASADYSFLRRGGRDGLNVRLHEKQQGPPLVDLGILINANDRDGAKFGVGARVTFLDLGGPLSELRLDGNIGGINQASVEYYWRPGSGMFFFAPGFSYRNDALPYYNGDFETARFSVLETRGGADLGLALGRKTEWRVGYAMEHSSFRVSSGNPSIEGFAGRWSILHTRFVHDAQDAAVIASRGFRTDFAADYSITAPLGRRTGVVRLESQNQWTKTLSPHYRLITRMNGGWTSKNDFLARPFTLGGEAGLVALARYQMLGNRYYYGSAMFLRSITKGNKPLYGVFQWEAGRAGLEGTMRPYQDGALGFVSETALGVLFCGYAMGEQGERRIFFHLGLLN